MVKTSIRAFSVEAALSQYASAELVVPKSMPTMNGESNEVSYGGIASREIARVCQEVEVS